VIAIAIPALLALSAPRLQADAGGPAAQGILDKYDVTEHDMRMRKFSDLIGRMDDALRVNAVDRYNHLNTRLLALMSQEVRVAKQNRRKLHESAVRGTRDRVLEAEMGSWVGGYEVKRTPSPGTTSREERLAVRRVSEMKKLLQRAREIRANLRDGNTGACTTNAAIADRFLALMRANRAAARKLQ